MVSLKNEFVLREVKWLLTSLHLPSNASLVLKAFLGNGKVMLCEISQEKKVKLFKEGSGSGKS